MDKPTLGSIVERAATVLGVSFISVVGTVYATALTLGGKMLNLPTWPLLLWSFLGGAALMAFVFAGWYRYRLRSVVKPRIWLEQASMLVDTQMLAGIKVRIILAILGNVPVDSAFVVGIIPLSGSSIYMTRSNAKYNIVDQQADLLVFEIRPEPEIMKEFQSIAEAVRNNNAVRVSVECKDMGLRTHSDGLLYEALR